MSNSATQTPPELEVSNFGPIVEAKIDLRPLTVFVGPSNTGKSYLAILIYALHRFFSGFKENRFSLGPHFSKEMLDAFDKWAQKTVGKREMKSHIALPDELTGVIRSILTAESPQLGNEISRCFGIEISRLVRKGNKDTAVVFRIKNPDDSTPFELRSTFSTMGGNVFQTKIPEEMSIQVDEGQNRWWMKRLHLPEFTPDREAELDLLIRELLAVLMPELAGPLNLPAFYLPASRTGVMHAHSVVVSAMIGSAPMTGLRPAAATPMLSGVLADFLQQLIEIDRPRIEIGRVGSRWSRPPFAQHGGLLAGRIEEAILGGSVRVDRSETIGYPHFTYQPTGWRKPLPLMNASSMVSELAPVVLYLRHVVQSGETLVIEEPESHLHPAMQVEFTRQLAALVKAGVRVIVTTHSEWVLEELANIVRRSELPAARRKEIPRGESALRSDQVGAWLFEPKRRPKGSIVREIRLDDSGLYPTEFDEVARILHNDWADISSWIGDAE